MKNQKIWQLKAATVPGGFEWSSIAVGPLGWELPFQVCHSPQQVSCPHFLTGFEFLIDSECVLCNWVSHLCTLLACQPAWALVCASCGWHQQFPYIGIPLSIQAQLLAKSPCLQKTPSSRLCKWINIDLVKSHFERLNLWANAFKPSTLHGGWLYWADGMWLLCSAPRMGRRKHPAGVLSVGIIKSVFHAPRSPHSDVSAVLHRSLISWCVV